MTERMKFEIEYSEAANVASIIAGPTNIKVYESSIEGLTTITLIDPATRRIRAGVRLDQDQLTKLIDALVSIDQGGETTLHKFMDEVEDEAYTTGYDSGFNNGYNYGSGEAA
jgi:hypothetical protein